MIMEYELLDQLVMASVVFSALCIILAFMVFVLFDWLDSLSHNSGEESEEITIKEQNNMKNIFCKIIELEEHQVLVVKSFESRDDGDFYQLEIRTLFDGFEPTTTIDYRQEDVRDKAYDSFTTEKAQQFIDDYQGMIRN